MSDTGDNVDRFPVIEIRAHEGGRLVLDGETPIGLIGPNKTIQTPSGMEYTIREGRGAARLWSAEGRPVVSYDREPDVHIKDMASGVVWSLRPDWKERARGDAGVARIRLSEAFAVEYTLEDAQATMPARVKLLLAYVVPPIEIGG